MLDSPPVVYKDILITGGSNTEGEPAGPVRRHPRLGRAQRQAAVVVPHRAAPGRAGCRDLGRRELEEPIRHERVDVHDRRCRARPGLRRDRLADVGLLRRRSQGPATSMATRSSRWTRPPARLKWFQQLVHHDIWDWDLPAAPTLIEVTQNGRTIPAVAQMTKMSTLFIFDRVTGEPLFGMEERPVPQSDVPGEATWPTQPFPRSRRRSPDHFRSRDGSLHADARARRATAATCGTRNRMYTKGMFTPPALDRHDGDVSRARWAAATGAACPTTTRADWCSRTS